MKQIIIAGGTGFIGQNLSRTLTKAGYSVMVLGRNTPDVSLALSDQEIIRKISGAHALINLAGAPVAVRWTRKAWDTIRSSRVDVTRRLAGIASAAGIPVLINASATGFYPAHSALRLDEDAPTGDGRLAGLAREWEAAANTFTGRKVLLRIGVVLGDGGYLNKVSLPFRFFAGGTIGTGGNYVPWIHIHDLCAAILFLIARKDVHGPFNIVAPQPATSGEIASAIGKAMHSPSYTVFPEFAARLVFGEMAGEVLFSSQLAIPRRLTESGFTFSFPRVSDAVADILGKKQLNH